MKRARRARALDLHGPANETPGNDGFPAAPTFGATLTNGAGDRLKILHVFFGSVENPVHKFLGTTKDIRGRTQYFRERSLDYEELILSVRKEKFLFRALEELDLSRFGTVFIEGTYYPRSVAYLRREYPHLKIIMRAINAELLHWLHSAYAAVRFSGARRAWADLKGLARFGTSDIRCARKADYILSIAHWETLHYWPRLAPRARIRTLPYFLPESYLAEIPRAGARAQRCVCMMTTKAGRPFLIDAAKNLDCLVRGLGEEARDWSFAITGDFEQDRVSLSPRIEVLGFLDNPLELLAHSRAVALLSDYGFGFKTKLLDALCCGCRLLVTRRLYSRLPAAVQAHAIVVDPRSAASFREALALTLEPPPATDANAELRREAYFALDDIFGIAPQERQDSRQPPQGALAHLHAATIPRPLP